MKQQSSISSWLADHELELIQAADYIFQHPELAYKEELSSKYLSNYLEQQGFHISKETAGVSTAFTAEWGHGKPVLGFLAEYDALAELGHACGHNLLGTGVAAAACALKADMEATGASGIIRVYGCPAEEIMSGKIVMMKQGVFQDLDVAVTWHPFDRNRISNDIWQSQDIKNYTFHGVSAHASRNPENGRSALDAAELMNIGVNYLREHVPTDVRMHYTYIDNGQPANVVPDLAKTNYFIRSNKRSRTEDVSQRVDSCAKGAALMTGTTVDIELLGSCKEMKVNRVLAELYYQAMKEIDAACALNGGGPAFVAMFIEAMADGGVKQGLPRATSYRLAAQTCLGTAKMILEKGIHPGELKDMVTSPGGTTIEGCEALERGGMRGAVIDCINKAAEKSKKL